MDPVEAAGAGAGKYAPTVSESPGVQVGDHNTQVNHFIQEFRRPDVPSQPAKARDLDAALAPRP